MQWTRRDGSLVEQRATPGFRPGYDVDYTRPVTGGPNVNGFDEYFGISASLDMSPYCFIENDRTVGTPDIRTPEQKDMFLNQVPGVKTADFELEGVMPACVAKAKAFFAKKDPAPFFLYMPLSAPHLPIVPSPRFAGKSKAGRYGDFVMEVDDAVREIVAALDAQRLLENTLIIFTSDNGGLWHWWNAVEKDDLPGSMTARGRYVHDFGHSGNAHLRGTKADIWEGGHRVPFVASWPKGVKAGARCDHLVCLTDVIATCAQLTGARLPEGAGEDSISFARSLTNPSAKQGARRGVVLHSLAGVFGYREGDWKYVPTRGSGGFTKPARIETKPSEPEGQLFHLRNDPSETTNLYAQHPDVVKRLAAELDKARQSHASR